MLSFGVVAVVLLVILAFFDLIVGVVNDAVNFLNSAIGSKVTSRRVILIFAAIGILIGATFSDGIIEVARKGIFSPEYFTSAEALILFTAVAFADIILLDLYSTFGLPTSTTVSVVFELFGAALVLAFWKMGGITEAWMVINTASAMKIVIGILLSICIAFSAGLIVQFLSRLVFTFDYKERFKKWGGVWSAVALTCLLFFILLKGGKHATFMTSDVKAWIAENTKVILGGLFAFFLVLSQILIKFRINVLKIIVLIGTASLAMAFAGNDLANFIGVSVAGTHAFLGADLAGKLPTPTWVLLLAGAVMVFAIFTSKKARTVTNTEVTLASHEKHVKDHWKTNVFAERFTKIFYSIFRAAIWILPARFKAWFAKRWEKTDEAEGRAFDLIRASVNLMVSAAVISYATSKKLPLSTTYVTFMVAMGTALADKAWGHDCAPSRILGVFVVVGGWFVTALMAFTMAGITVSILYFAQTYGLIFMALVVSFIVYKLHHLHERRRA